MIELETAADHEEDHSKQGSFEDDESESNFDQSSAPGNASPWQIGAGAAVMAAGVVLPVLSIAVSLAFSFEGIWRLILLHPLETLIEAFLVASVPAANYAAWHSLCYGGNRNPIRLGIFNGVAIAVPAITLAISIACFALGYPLIDSVTKEPHNLSVALMGAVSIPALIVALYLTFSLRNAKQTRDAKIRTILYSLMGIGLTLVSFLGAEARSTYIRIAENWSLSDEATERETGLAMLRGADPEKELKMECADVHTAGIAGLFLPLNADAQKRLFFAATGKPYRDRQNTNMSLMSNDYLKNHVVGSTVDGLSLHRSAIFGKVHPNTLSSTLDWNFVFKNKTYMNQEARAELALPEGAVISGLTLWINGVEKRGSFRANEQAGGSYQWINVQHKDPALITDLGRGRYLLQASPVPGQGEMKVQLTITEPLKLDGEKIASFGMPHFIDQNFSLTGEHEINLRSKSRLITGSKLSAIKPVQTLDGEQLLLGSLKEDDISKSTFSVKVDSPIDFKTIATKDPSSAKFFVEELKTKSSNAPRHLVVVVDASQAMKSHVEEVVAALENVPGDIDTKVVLAGDKKTEPVTLSEGIAMLKKGDFGGGQDNLQALVKAAERAGENKDGAVLWIHGPQPGYNNENYLMPPYAAAPSFFEIALDDCLTDTNDFFKNHREIGPFNAVARSGPLGEDLKAFLSKWKPGAKETFVEIASVLDLAQAPTQLVEKDDAASREVAVLAAAHQAADLIRKGDTVKAATLGANYQIVTPVTSAVVLEQGAVNPTAINMGGPNAAALPQSVPQPANNTQANSANLVDSALNNTAQYQGSTNGTVGPQGTDATVIQGVNTAGTVRVNNLANLESLLCIFANGGELFGLVFGLANAILGGLGKGMYFPFRLGAKGRIAFGICIAFIGLAIPGCINWMCASARDANLFD